MGRCGGPVQWAGAVGRCGVRCGVRCCRQVRWAGAMGRCGGWCGGQVQWAGAVGWCGGRCGVRSCRQVRWAGVHPHPRTWDLSLQVARVLAVVKHLRTTRWETVNPGPVRDGGKVSRESDGRGFGRKPPLAWGTGAPPTHPHTGKPH